MEVNHLQKSTLSPEVSTHVASTGYPHRNRAKESCGSLAARNEPVESHADQQRAARNEDHVRLHDDLSCVDWSTTTPLSHLGRRYSSSTRSPSTPHSSRCS